MSKISRRIESRADRGPHADARDVVARALATGPSSTDSSAGKSAWWLAAASVAIVATGVAAVITVGGPSEQPARSDRGALPTIDERPTDSGVGAEEVLAEPIPCATVAYRIENPPVGFEVLTPSGTSTRSEMLFDVASDLTLARGTPLVEATAPTGREEEVLDVVIEGFASQVSPGLGPSGLGPQVRFVFPANGDATDTCNLWALTSLNGELSTTAFAAFASALRFEVDGVTGSRDSTDSGSATVEEFCSEFASFQDERPESYVGSPEHLAEIEELLAVAPGSVAADVATFRDYLSSGAIDSESDSDSNLAENWPDEVQTAIQRTQSFAADNC